MPTSPWVDPKLGYYSQHNQANIIGNLTQSPYVFTGNNLGSKTAHNRDIRQNLSFIRDLGIIPEAEWIDQDISNIAAVKALVDKGLTEDWIQEQERETFLCSCGRTEFLNASENLIQDQERTTYTVDSSGVFCKFCNGSALLETRRCLVMKLPEIDLPKINIYPDYAKAEIDHFLRTFRGRDYLLSRTNYKPVLVEVARNVYWVDVDMSWMLFLYILQEEYGYRVNTLLTGNRTLKQVALALLVGCRLRTILPTTIVAAPRIDIDFEIANNFKPQDFLGVNGRNTTKVFLAKAFGTRAKSIILKYSDAKWIGKSINGDLGLLIPTESPPPLQDFLKSGNNVLINNLMKKIRARRFADINNYEKWLLWAILK